MTPEETQVIETLSARMTPRCVGRYLVDLPEGFVINPITTTKLEGVDITVTPIQVGAFERTLSQRETTLRKMHMDGAPDKSFLKRVENTPSIQLGKVFNRSEASGTSEIARTLELFAWKAGYQILMTINGTDGTDQMLDPKVIGTPFETSARRILEEYKNENDVPEKLAHLLNVYERVRGRNDLEVPTEQGVCFANGFLRGEPNDEEQIDLYYHLRTAKDVYFAFHSLSDLHQDDELLDRGKAIERMLEESSGYTLRKGNVKGPIASAQEWLMSKKSSDSGLLYQHFTLEANAKTASAMTPVLVLDMNAGIQIPGPALSLEEAAVRKPLSKTTFSEAQSVALWNKVAPTLRPRPVSTQKAALGSSAEPLPTSDASAPRGEAPRLPLGTSLASGIRCPQSGFWQCMADAVGGDRRFITAGETLPGVLLPVERSFLQKLTGRPQNRLAETVWTLVGYPDSTTAV